MSRKRHPDAEHHRLTAPTHPHSWLWWVGAAGLVGVALLPLGRIDLDGMASGRLLVLLQALSLALTTSVYYWVLAGTARAAMSRRSPREVLGWLRSERVVSTWASSLLAVMAIFALAVLMEALSSPAGFEAPLLIGVVLMTYRALVLVYRDHVINFSMTPRDRRSYLAGVKDARPAKASRRALARLRPNFLKPDARERMGFPLLQTIVFVYAPVTAVSWLMITAAGGPAPRWAADLVALPAAASGMYLWALWNRSGGMAGIFRRLKALRLPASKRAAKITSA